MPTETIAPRLIDANALNNKLLHGIERTWGKEGAKVFATIIAEIDSAPTVETTDDVMARLPKIIRDGIEFQLGWDESNQKWYAGYFDGLHSADPSEVGFGETKFEAVKKLEAALRA